MTFHEERTIGPTLGCSEVDESTLIEEALHLPVCVGAASPAASPLGVARLAAGTLAGMGCLTTELVRIAPTGGVGDDGVGMQLTAAVSGADGLLLVTAAGERRLPQVVSQALRVEGASWGQRVVGVVIVGERRSGIGRRPDGLLELLRGHGLLTLSCVLTELGEPGRRLRPPPGEESRLKRFLGNLAWAAATLRQGRKRRSHVPPLAASSARDGMGALPMAVPAR